MACDPRSRRLTREELLARANKPGEDALRLHALYRGKMQALPKCAVRGLNDLAIWSSPGVAAPSRAIQTDPELVYAHTNKANSVAIVTDGTRVLGLGDIGPEAALPVMEAKALLFKYLGGVDAVPICLGTRHPEEIARAVQVLQPTFGGIDLEGIAQPKCFRILEALQRELRIPVWHGDPQGAASCVLAGLLSALKLVGKDRRNVAIALIGAGAAGVASYRLLTASGVSPAAIVACDRRGTLHRGRRDVEARQEQCPEKWRLCRETNAGGVTGGIAEALRGADVCIAFSAPGPGIIRPEWVQTMAARAIVFAGANPVPEIWPWDAKAAGARIVATGRGDFPNQLDSALVFPGLFRGVLDVRARSITDEMALAAALELARFAERRSLRDDDILPRMDEWDVFSRVAVAVGLKAQEQGIAQLRKGADDLHGEAAARTREAREATYLLMRGGIIRAPREP
jgi:malate dehydrogenase (oxaloacetate-decarboxylating)